MRLRSLLPAVLTAGALVLTGCSSGNVFSLEVGDCFDDPSDTSGEISDVPIVECSEPHDNEVFAVFDIPGDDFPGQSEVQEQADDGCLDRFADYVGIDYAESRFIQTSLYPTEGSWDGGDREVICFLYDIDLEKLEGSMAGSAE